MFLYPEVVPKLKALHDDGVKIVFVTNQAGVEKGKSSVQELTTKLSECHACHDLSYFLKPCHTLSCPAISCDALSRLIRRALPAAMRDAMGFPITTLACTGENHFRKPSIQLWEYLLEHCNDGIKPDLSKVRSFG